MIETVFINREVAFDVFSKNTSDSMNWKKFVSFLLFDDFCAVPFGVIENFPPFSQKQNDHLLMLTTLFDITDPVLEIYVL